MGGHGGAFKGGTAEQKRRAVRNKEGRRAGRGSPEWGVGRFPKNPHLEGGSCRVKKKKPLDAGGRSNVE